MIWGGVRLEVTSPSLLCNIGPEVVYSQRTFETNSPLPPLTVQSLSCAIEWHLPVARQVKHIWRSAHGHRMTLCGVMASIPISERLATSLRLDLVRGDKVGRTTVWDPRISLRSKCSSSWSPSECVLRLLVPCSESRGRIEAVRATSTRNRVGGDGGLGVKERQKIWLVALEQACQVSKVEGGRYGQDDEDSSITHKAKNR
ncbi:hypothetical protein EDB86DRAFT_1286358 [Lactarius hatsudake]|nr:hypothetical protein EDB86DRAFT_1286358 [Lactarius hatsudake]